MGGTYFSSMMCWLRCLMDGGWGSLVYRGIFVVFFLFLLGSRVPYIFGLHFFIGGVLFFVVPVYFSLLFSRLMSGFKTFLVSLMPTGTPLWIAPAIFYIELISFFIRPVVLVLRPIVNLSFGCFGTAAGFHCVLDLQGFCVPLLFVFFVYETILLIVHWYIVHQILLFTHEG